MYETNEIATLIGAHRIGDKNYEVDWLLTDSRSLCFPETTLFFAITTSHADGHRYIPTLYDCGVRSFVVERVPEGSFPDAVFLEVPHTVKALQRLAERHRETFDIPIIGITGSNGKTIVKEWLYQCLSTHYVITRSPRSYNSQIGVPLSVWGLWKQSQMGIFEAGISQPGEMAALESIIQPTIGVFTCLGTAHQENFESMEQKCMEKLILFKDAEALIYPADDQTVVHCIEKSGFKGKLVPWHFTGDAITDNQAICRVTCQYLDLDKDEIEQSIQNLEPVAMRLEVTEGQNGCTLIDDAYNSDLNSLDIALDFMNRRNEKKNQRMVVILSDIEQTGLPSSMLYSSVAKMLEPRAIDLLIGVGTEIGSQKKCFDTLHTSCSFFPSTQALIDSPLLPSLSDSLILIKGARNFHFEQVTDLLEQKQHETILEVNLNAVAENLKYYRSFMKPETRIICMVKADAYGAGAIEISKTLQVQHVDYLAVAVADEGAALRKAGIYTNIMVMNPEMGSLKLLFRHHLEPEVYSFRLLDALIKAAENEGVTHFPIHLKLDTGMHRMGFDPLKDMEEVVRRLKNQTSLIPRSVFSHFVGSDDDRFDDFSRQQFQLFMQGSDELQKAFPHHILRHICNSAGIEHFPQYQLDMVRLGLGLYGINSRNGEIIHNVCTLKTTILQIHQLAADETIGYSRRTTLERPSRVASIPIGYADGLDRHMGNRKGFCLVNGQKAVFLGNICMDVSMIDVTEIPCNEGDEVIIFGEAHTPTEIANTIGTIPYEVLTGVSPRVKRVYFQE